MLFRKVSQYIALLFVSNRLSYTPVWPHTHSVAPDKLGIWSLASASWLLGLPVCTTMLGVYSAQDQVQGLVHSRPALCRLSSSQILAFFNLQINTKLSNNLVLLGGWFLAMYKASHGYRATASVRECSRLAWRGKTGLHSSGSSGFLRSCQALFQTAAWNRISKADGTLGLLV